MPVGMCVMRTAEFGLVDVLAARARGAIRVDAAVALVDVDLDAVVDHRIDPDGGEARVPARVRIERRDAHQAMHARFGLQPAVGVVALDHDGRGLDARLVAGRLLDHLDVEFPALRPAHVHAQQHARPVAAFGAARRRNGLRHSCRWRRPRPRAAPRAGGARPRPSAPSARRGPRPRSLRRPRPRRVRPASSRRRGRARILASEPSRSSSIVRSRITFCAASASFQRLGSSDLALSSASRRVADLDVKDASSAVPRTA